MATITQSRKRAPIAKGELFSVGATGANGEWTEFSIGVRQDNCTDGESRVTYTTLRLDRAEAERLVRQLSGYVNGKPERVNGAK